MASLFRDLRFGLRTLLKAPGFTAVVVLTLALGIGANTAIFSFLHGILVEPLRYDEPEQLVTLWETSAAEGEACSGQSSEEAEHQALEEELTGDPATSRPQGCADGDLLLTPLGPHEEQIRYVRAGD